MCALIAHVYTRCPGILKPLPVSLISYTNASMLAYARDQTVKPVVAVKRSAGCIFNVSDGNMCYISLTHRGLYFIFNSIDFKTVGHTIALKGVRAGYKFDHKDIRLFETILLLFRDHKVNKAIVEKNSLLLEFSEPVTITSSYRCAPQWKLVTEPVTQVLDIQLFFMPDYPVSTELAVLLR